MKFQALVLLCLLFLILPIGWTDEKGSVERMVVVRSRGDSAVQETFEISADGQFKYSDIKTSKKVKLEGETLKSFLAAANAVDWEKLPAKKTAEGAARFKADLFSYNVALVVNKKLRTITFHESGYADDKTMQAFLTELLKLK